MLKTSRGLPRPWWKRHRTRFEQLVVTAVLLVVASGLYAVESRAVVSRGELRVWFFDVGQGDATLIETPDGHQILVDGGPDDAVLAKLGEVLGPLDRSLDLVLATHPDADHIGGLARVIRDYDVGEVAANGDRKFTATARDFEDASDAETDAERVVVRAGQTWQFGDVTIRAVWPRDDRDVAAEDANASSVVLLVTYSDTSVLLTGDATDEAEAAYAASIPDVDVLKAAHHGSATSSSYAFLADVTPEIAVVSCGLDNRYGHPHPAILARFDDLGIDVLRTDQDGDILLTSDGGEPTVTPAPLPF